MRCHKLPHGFRVACPVRIDEPLCDLGFLTATEARDIQSILHHPERRSRQGLRAYCGAYPSLARQCSW